jgi:hypothetical protein
MGTSLVQTPLQYEHFSKRDSFITQTSVHYRLVSNRNRIFLLIIDNSTDKHCCVIVLFVQTLESSQEIFTPDLDDDDGTASNYNMNLYT